MKILLTLCLAIFLSHATDMGKTKQLIVVTTKNWSVSNGVLQRYEKQKNSWQKVGKSINIKLGRNGIGWGRGLHQIPKNAKIVKKEGDGKAPAGLFELKQAFGYAPLNIDYPYRVYKETDHCVDDVNSKLYNSIVDSKSVKVDYKSFEHMKFPKDFYKYGIVVNHNNIDEKGSLKGAGSCIFLHIKEIPTAGCTVMKESEIKEILYWLDTKKRPLLVQGTKEVVNGFFKNM